MLTSWPRARKHPLLIRSQPILGVSVVSSKGRHVSQILVTGRYIPPGLRKQLEGDLGSQEDLTKLTRQLKGLLNRYIRSTTHVFVQAAYSHGL